MTASYVPERHSELQEIGRRTHEEIDDILDGLGASGATWKVFEVTLESAHLVGEVSPTVVRIPLPNGMTFAGAQLIRGYVDGIRQPVEYGWRPADDDIAIEVYVPTDVQLRARYLANATLYTVEWLS